MFQRSKLKNFRQHEDREFFFGEGMTAIRGPNEKGKSTLIEATLYALFGVTALREPSLEKAVTWGRKPSTLRVEVDKLVDGVVYTFIRSQSGAEVRHGEKILATGQTEVRKFAESLLGCSADTASSLMLASQKDLQGVLSGKPGEGVQLIEKLANFELLDRIIELVQTHLSAGTTNIVEGRIESLQQQLAQEVPNNLAALEQAEQAAQQAWEAAEAAVQPVFAQHLAQAAPSREAEACVQEHARCSSSYNTAARAVEVCQTSLSTILIPEAVPEAEITRLQAQIAEANDYARLVQAWGAFQRLSTEHDEWEGGEQSLADAVNASVARCRELATELSRLDVKYAETRALLITGTTCKLCSKDLSDVPEVVAQNLRLNETLQALDQAKEQAQTALADEQASLAQMQDVQAHQRGRQEAYRTLHAYTVLDNNYVPSRVTWAGSAVPSEAPKKPTEELAKALRTNQTRQQALGRQEQASASLAAAQVALGTAQQALQQAQAKLPAAQELLRYCSELLVQLNALQANVSVTRQAYEAAKAALASERRVVETREAHRKATEDLIKAAQEELAEMRDNNELLKVLRAAKPEIARELWALVAASVSKYFTDIRGEASIFSRDSDGFSVNGKGVKSLSGSALDSLGLAIRLALTRTFLPNTDFLVVDEPAAAADDNREQNMLGVLAASGFRQVLCVTHSDKAEAFANQTLYV